MSQRINGSLKVDGAASIGTSLTVAGTTIPIGRVYAAETGARGMSTTETNFTQMSGLTLSPAPNGTRKYRLSFRVEYGASSANAQSIIRFYAGSNGTMSDTLIATFSGFAHTTYGAGVSSSGFEFTPTAAQTKVGISHDLSTGTATTVANVSFIEITAVN